jgi:hypothetical protein
MWRALTFAFFAALFYVSYHNNMPAERGLFAVYAIAVMLFIVFFFDRNYRVASSTAYMLKQPALLHVVWVVFFLNGFSPYIGLKTESSISMFSNLHVEGGITNHLWLSKPPYLFDYIDTEQIATIHETNNPYLLKHNVEPKKDAIWFEVLRHMQEGDYAIRFTMNGREYDVAHSKTSPVFAEKIPLWKYKWLYFKPVDWRRPKACSH